MYESQLEDLIAKNIAQLEKGLVLLQKEKYIPNLFGTRGFIDLYAKDIHGNHVLIELKRSNAAAREAIHEVYKYVEGVKRHLGAKEHEIRVIIASTEWRELLIPFSRFVFDTQLEVKGLQINIVHPDKIEVLPISVLSMEKGRFIAPWHDMCWYLNEQTLHEGIRSMEKACKVKEIEDYVILVFRLSKPMVSQKQESMMAALVQMAEINGLERKRSIELPCYEFIAYFAVQKLSKEKCLQILSVDQEEYAEAQDIISDMEDDEEALCYLHESIAALEPSVQADFHEIGYPGKISEYLENPQCELQEVRRYGLFRRNKLLQDKDIISELKGDDGSTNQKFKRTVSVSSRAQMNSVRSEIESCLKENPIWKNHILRCLSEIETQYPLAEVDLSIFNPAMGVFTLYMAATREDGYLYVPSYYILIREPEPVRMYYGGFESNGQALSFYDILDKYYDGDIGPLLMTMTWGGKDSRDIDIAEDLGGIYRSFRCDIQGEERAFFKLRDDRWRECSGVDPIKLYDEYLEKNKKLVQQIVTKISPRDHFGFMDGSDAEKVLDQTADISKGEKLKKYYVNPPEECDLCGCELKREKYMVDGQVKNSFAWAAMCQDCAVFLGSGIGWGRGQLYLNQNGKWLLVGGFEDDGEDETIDN